MDLYTPSGIAYMIKIKEIELKKLHQQRVETAHRKQNDHPRYMQMSEREFKLYIIDSIRFNLRKAHDIKEDIKRLNKMLEK